MWRISKIANGWKNYLSGTTTEEERRRAAICKACPHAIMGTWEKLLPDFELKEVQGLKCNICKCPLAAKIRSTNEKCPLNKWKAPTN